MRSERDVVRAVAEQAGRRVARRTRVALQKLTDCTLSGDDSELKDVWDEVCVQIQGDKSIFWDLYDQTVRTYVASFVDQLKDYEMLALWLQTDQGWDWLYEEEDKREVHPPLADDKITDYVLHEYVYGEAGWWTNERIVSFFDRQP